MLKALEQAKIAFNKNEVPVGAIIVRNNLIISSSYNMVIENNDPTAHAEINVIRQACSLLENFRLVDCDIYVTLEPCPMCAQAISNARIKRLFFGAYDIKSGGVDNGARIFNQSSCFFIPEIYGGIMEKDCSNILKEFFINKR